MRGQKRERIIRTLLSEKLDLSKYELAKRSDCARPWVIEFLRKLESMGLMKQTRVVDRKKLLEYWVSIHKKPKKYREYMVKNPLDLLKSTDLDYALTTYQAENLVQHYLFPSRIDLYIKEEEREEWHLLLSKNGLVGKGNIRIIIEDHHVMHRSKKINDLFVVSIPQLILDLLEEGGPCIEAAEMLMKRL